MACRRLPAPAIATAATTASARPSPIQAGFPHAFPLTVPASLRLYSLTLHTLIVHCLRTGASVRYLFLVTFDTLCHLFGYSSGLHPMTNFGVPGAPDVDSGQTIKRKGATPTLFQRDAPKRLPSAAAARGRCMHVASRDSVAGLPRSRSPRKIPGVATRA